MTALPYFNGTRPYEIMEYINTVTDGVFGYVFVSLVWFMVYMSFSQKSPKHGVAAASYVTALLSILLVILRVNTTPLLVLSLVLICVALAASYGETLVD